VGTPIFKVEEIYRPDYWEETSVLDDKGRVHD